MTTSSFSFFIRSQPSCKIREVHENLLCRRVEGYIIPGGAPYDGLYREAPSEMGIFFRLQVYERVGISLVEIYKRVGK